MAFHFRPASRSATNLLVMVAGPSGSGKTLSALRMAAGLRGDGPVVVIDTEQGRALQYAPPPGAQASPPESFEFLHAIVSKPFRPATYGEAIKAAGEVKPTPSVIIIDSISHEWDGPGGILDWVDEIKSNMKNEFGAWSAPKQEHQKKVIGQLLQLPCHVIVCARAKEKRGVVFNSSSRKNEVVDLGWHPICESGLPYEMTVSFILKTDRKGTPQIDGYDYGKLPINMRSLVRETEQITEDTGRALRAWACGDEHPAGQSGTPESRPGPAGGDGRATAAPGGVTRQESSGDAPIMPGAAPDQSGEGVASSPSPGTLTEHELAVLEAAETAAEGGMDALTRHCEAAAEADKALLRANWGALSHKALRHNQKE